MQQGECPDGEESQHLDVFFPRGPEGHQGRLQATFGFREAGKVRRKHVDVAEYCTLHGGLVQTLKQLQVGGGEEGGRRNKASQ